MPVKKSELYSLLWEACNKLRGGVEPARYKDYVLVLLFFKYISDKYNNDPYSDFTVPEGASFETLINAKGKKEVGETVNKTLQRFLEANKLTGSLPAVSFENTNELGTGKELIDRVSGLIGVFQDPALDFRSNRASGDDIIGDAYEYFMMKFAQESGKSKGQFYTPAEVSRIIARLIGIGNVTEKVTVYDPAAGSGSLLIRAADEAPVNSSGFSLASIYGQEIDISTAGLAKMNFILHQRGTGQIQKGNTLSDPKYLDEFGQLERFDFIVMNPPFSQKSWSDGVNIESDIYNRFEGFGIPPMKNGDYAWLLHVIKSLAQNGKAGIVLPHGVLFRGNAEEIIRIQLIKTKYIRGIVSLPPNLFYGVGIPACLMFIDKENAPAREGIFFIDASNGFKKDGNKNRLREQDIERIVRVYNAQQEIEGYSRLVPYSEILESNGGNLNVPRYIQKPDDTLPHNITAHLNGGIPEYDINTLAKIWRISPSLKEKIFAFTDGGIYRLAVKAEETEKIFGDDETLRAQKLTEGTEIFAAWADEARDSLMNINGDTNPRNLIRELGDSILSHYDMAMIVDKYSVFDVLMNYWNGAMQDDVYMIRAYGWEAGRNIAYEYDKKGKITSWEGELIPREIIEHEYFSHELDAIEALSDETASLNAEIEDLRGDSDPDDELPPETLKTISRKENEARKLSREAKRLRKELDEAVIKKYKDLSVDEIKRLLFNAKWLARLSHDISIEIDGVMNECMSRLMMIAERYGRTLVEIEKDTDESREAVRNALGRMGYVW
ncbi:MAG: SAM-dependent DNA methyltransferase [Synergistaceae bacterium]|nr:SAM-dependent DNA methyltransferase [Synergistaceae bacterium]